MQTKTKKVSGRSVIFLKSLIFGYSYTISNIFIIEAAVSSTDLRVTFIVGQLNFLNIFEFIQFDFSKT